MKRRKLTNRVLKRLVREERQKLQETLELGLNHPSEAAKRTKEIDADKYAKTLEDAINHYKLMKLKEAKLKKQLQKIQETKRILKKRMLRDLD